MFATWMKEHDLKDFPLENRLFPPAEDRAFWEKYLGKPQIESAETLLGCDWPLIRASAYIVYQREGDRLAHEDPHFERRHRLIALFLGELAENKGRFLGDLCDGIFAICEETHWGVSAHNVYTNKRSFLPNAEDPYIDLFSAETGELLGVIYHILADRLEAYCPGMKARLEYELERRILAPYLTHSDYFWMGRLKNVVVNNWNPWILSNILTVALTVPMRESKKTVLLERMFEEVQRYYDTIPADGGCDEGPMYWVKAAAKLLMLCEQLYVASGGKLDLFGDEKLARMGKYEEAVYIQGLEVVCFADCVPRMTNYTPEVFLYLFGLRTGQETLCRLAGQMQRTRKEFKYYRGISIKEMLYARFCKAHIESQPEFVPENRYVLPDLQVACLREGNWYYAAKGGHNAESHNHNDVGSFLVYYEEQPVLVDVGSGVYTKDTFSGKRYSCWNVCSDWHNLPTVNGIAQKNGRAFAADGFRVDGRTTEISFAGAYPEEAGLKRAVRRIHMTDGGVEICDCFRFLPESSTVTLHFITALKPEITPEGAVLGGQFLLKNPAPCTVAYKDFGKDAKLCESWRSEGIYRVTFIQECGKTATVKTELRRI